jgi:2-oxoisovalerate dehydrogenase E1 component beta subunit
MATMVQALRLALHVGEEQLGVTDIFGQDVGPPLGGVFTATQGLRTTWNTPLDERGIIGAAMGLAMAGQKPVCEIQFCDYAFNTIDLLKIAGNTYWSSNGAFNLPMVMMTPVGAGIHGSIYHSHSFDAQATRIPGWKIFMPSNPRDAYGMLLSAIEDPNPVMVLVPKALMRSKATGPDELIPGEPVLPNGEADGRALGKMIDAPLGDRDGWAPEWPVTAIERVPIGVAKTVRAGNDVSVFTYGRMVHVVKKVANDLADQMDIEVIDLRSLHPYDWAAIAASVRKTGRAVFVNEDTEITNFGEHLIRRTVEELWDALKTPPILEAGKHVPGVGLAESLENASVPGYDSVVAAIGRAMHGPSRRDLFPKKKNRLAMDYTLTDERPETLDRSFRHR